MEKVKLPREVAEAIKGSIRNGYEEVLYDLRCLFEVCENDLSDAAKLMPIYEWIVENGRKLYFTALINGYEIEETPEEKVRDLYNRHLGNGDEILAEVVVDVLERLLIKVEGVNA